MRVLITVASKHNATAEIGVEIAFVLQSRGIEVVNLPPETVTDLAGYDAVIAGSSVYEGRWLKPAERFVTDHRDALTAMPTWLFSSGPIGDPPMPAEHAVSIDKLIQAVTPRDHAVFAGRLDSTTLGFVERALVRALRTPEGDFRDWEAIRAWAATIAGAPVPATAPRAVRA